MRKTWVLLIAIIQAVNVLAQDKVKVNCVKEESSIAYDMKHPLHEWTGESKEIKSIILTDESRGTIYQVAVSAKVSTFDSKNANRDSHMIEVTEALKFPDVTYVSNSVTLDGNEFTSSGNVTFHGISQPVALKGKFTKEGTKITFTGEFNLKLSQFKIDPPTLMGIKTEDDFKLKFKIVYQ
jgi:polyisoprenoid-binding protein YceI